MNNNTTLIDLVAIVPAAGNGRRMKSQFPKQYLTICGKTILEHSLDVLLQHPKIQRIVVALHPSDIHFQHLSLARDLRITTVQGGPQRTDSVLAALQASPPAEWVLIHDAARPCLRHEDLHRLLTLTISSQIGGILAVPVRDTIKRAIEGCNHIHYTVKREFLWHALTPQLFPRKLLRKCLEKVLSDGKDVTDEASALEYCGYYPELISGRSDNLKITHPEDLALAHFYITTREHS
ncbi:2-C-methyl-D-erythritol 4-phosphate cytidylyltransferase [Candidatus Erwinia haradaeae]|uniref:2-C-methyl-D-erythritol 4-phosphate cytidylyltransferase n=2 Tax=Candidatus Erwinia haradaeae TaxID=1922217 RepID=A0A451DDK6_9GAMM|nr:2-C-methyl-D-erythritol 4-phosphate cytidylyltransferase [Candidatus Erwinia haradaeae]VFP84538.1 2-C-methyl-D-erythritol 4-phosphate cytidylyltransferase [Candidatus Erwinia haradaeae]